jgi:hypothetical protein
MNPNIRNQAKDHYQEEEIPKTFLQIANNFIFSTLSISKRKVIKIFSKIYETEMV